MSIDYLFEPSASKELQLARQEYYKESSFVQMLLKMVVVYLLKYRRD